MNIVKIRSPFIIKIDEPTQVSSKVEIFAWNYGDAVPTIPNHVMVKDIPSASQVACYFDIAIVLDEFINVYNAVKTTNVETENDNAWCFFKVKRYYNDGTFKLLDTTNYIGINGFTEYIQGTQIPIVSDFYLLKNENIINTWQKNNNYGYFNLLVDGVAQSYELLHQNSEETFSYSVPSDLIFLKIPYSNSLFTNQNLPCNIYLLNTGTDVVEFSTNTNSIEECKYTPVECSFVNSNGGWEFLTFFKAQTNAISAKGSEYNLMPNKVDYDIHQGQSKMFNINGSQTIKVNTGWVDENYNILIHDLMLSETILLDDKPAKLKTQSHTFKTQLKDKMINFEIEFEYSYNLINNVE